MPTPGGYGLIDLENALGTDRGDRSVWAKALRESRKKNPDIATELDLAAAILNITITDTMAGSSTIELTLHDEGWKLVDSGFLDANNDGTIDPIDCNYPQGSTLWWRCTQIAINDATRQAATVQMTFMERAAVHLMQHEGPLTISRATRTRAQFIKMLSDKVKANGGITFHSNRLNERQPIEPEDLRVKRAREKRARDREEDRKKNKAPGINPNETLFGIQGKLKPWQIARAERMLDTARNLKAPPNAVRALMIAGLVEAPDFKNPRSGGKGGRMRGTLQYDSKYYGQQGMNLLWATRHFLLTGATGQGGAIKWAKAGLSPPQIIEKIHNPGGLRFYTSRDIARKAETIIEAFGGPDAASNRSGSGGGEYTKQYNFQVGGDNDPDETYWDAMQRLAREVKWALFLDGQHLYYDPETELIFQKPVAVIKRGDPALISFSANWDMRQIATEATLELVIEPFEVRAGETIKIEGFGPASTGSRHRLGGRWLIEEVVRERFSLVSTLHLKQPDRPNKEPRSPTVLRRDRKDEDPGKVIGTPKQVVDTVVLPIARKHGVSRTVAQNDAANKIHGPTKNQTPSDHQGPPSIKWAADLGVGTNKKRGDALAKELAKRFQAPHNGIGTFKRWRYLHYWLQILWQVDGHFGHVHFGIQRLARGPASADER